MSKTYQRFLEEVDMYTAEDIADQVREITNDMTATEAFEFYKELESRLDHDCEQVEQQLHSERLT